LKAQTTKLNQDKIDDMNNPLAFEEINNLKEKSPGSDGFTGKFKELTLILQFLPEDRQGGNSCQLILQSQYYSDTQTRRRQYKKKKTTKQSLS